jgi:hypothetical protein
MDLARCQKRCQARGTQARGTPHVAVLYAFFVELQLWVVVVGLPLLAVYEVARADLVSIRTPLLVAVRKENESGFDVL